jgi:hypothetical protein
VQHAEVVARLRQRRARLPAVADRIVFLVARHRLARKIAAERKQLIADRRRGDLAAYRRHRSFLRPGPARGLRLRAVHRCERGDDHAGGERSESEPVAHAALPALCFGIVVSCECVPI